MTFFLLIRTLVVQPLIFLFLPKRLARIYLKRLAKSSLELQPALSGVRAQLGHYFETTKELTARAELEQGITRKINHIDPWRSYFFETSTLKNHLDCESPPLPKSSMLILGGHVGNAWWVLPWLRIQSRQVHFVAAALPSLKLDVNTLYDWVDKNLQSWRWNELNRVSGAEVIEMQGASAKVRDALNENACVVALLDVPTIVCKRTEAVPFLGRTAFLPRRLIEVAVDAQASIWYLTGHFDLASMRYQLRLWPFEQQSEVEEVFEEYARHLEADIAKAPGRWMNWNEVEALFQQ
jgi:hypothetical protein